MKRVIIESPWAGNVEENKKYAIACLLDSLKRGEAPYASHLLYTRALDDLIPEQRNQGLQAAMAYVEATDLTAVYTDRGISRGMAMGIRHAQRHDKPVEYRMLNSLRQTGRTTSMVEAAVEDLKAGKNVLILTADKQQTDYIVDLLRRVGWDGADFVRSVSERLQGLSPDSVFVDHYAWSRGISVYDALQSFGSWR